MAVVRPFRSHGIETSPSIVSSTPTVGCPHLGTPDAFRLSSAVDAEAGDPQMEVALRQLPVWERLARLEESLSGGSSISTTKLGGRPSEGSEVTALKKRTVPRMDAPGKTQGLHDRVAVMDERSRLLNAEAQDLKEVIALKDGVIRHLGASLDSGASQVRELKDVLTTKDGIIRSLQTELGAATTHGDAVPFLQTEISTTRRALQTREGELRALQDQLSHTRETLVEREQQLSRCEHRDLASSRDIALEATKSSSSELHRVHRDGAADEERYTAFPTDFDARYVPVPGCALDSRIAAFQNGRRSRILFTRVESGGIYLYGRLAVRCWLDDCGGVVVRPRGCTQLPLLEFVTRHESAEHAYFEMSLFQRQSG